MKAAILESSRLFRTRQTKVPEPKPDEVQIRVEGCGVCNSSLPVWEGREWFNYPMAPGAPGHEGWGIIELVGSDAGDFAAGERVAFLSFHSYAEYDVVSKDSIVKLPSALGKQPFPGEPLGCAMNIFVRSNIRPGDTVGVIGLGFLGVLLCQLAKQKGVKVIAISRRAYSLDIARLHGADEVVALTSPYNVKNIVAEITNNEFCPIVIEATGKQEGVDVATEIVSEGGKIVIAGYHQDGMRSVNLQQWNWKGIDVINAHERKHSKYIQGMQLAVEAVTQGILAPAKLYTHLIALDEINTAFELTATRPPGFMKALITM